MIHLLLFKDGGGQDDAFAPLLDTGAQKQCAQVLLYGAGANVEFDCDLFIAASLHQQLKNLLVAAGDFDLIEVQHFSASSCCWNTDISDRSTSFAKVSPLFNSQKRGANTGT
jgi:hypothetical protein